MVIFEPETKMPQEETKIDCLKLNITKITRFTNFNRYIIKDAISYEILPIHSKN